MKEERPPLWMVVGVYSWGLASFVFCGSVLAMFFLESRRAALLAIGAFATALVIQLLIAAVEYRRTMRRPWPDVPPLPDDDDD